MIPRGKLDITYKRLFEGLFYCLFGWIKPVDVRNTLEEKDKILCLSVRTGFHLVLSALNLSVGSEIIVTDINIPDMFNIISAHKLKAVPVPVNKYTLNTAARQIEAAITPATKAILITHLFGGIMDTDEILSIATRQNLIMIEDCAQAFAGNQYKGNPLSDVIMYSFGLIKTNTAISGALLRINNPVIFAKVNQLNNELPEQSTNTFFKKLSKSLFIKLLTTKLVYSLFYSYSKQKRKDFDELLSGFTRGFPGPDLLKKISFRPSSANLQLLRKRISSFSCECLNKRIEYAKDILNNIPEPMKIGYLNKCNSYWILPVEARRPNELVNYLRSKGFDATQKASSLVKIEGLVNQNPDELLLENLVYLPSYIAMTKKDRVKLGRLVACFTSAPKENNM